MSKELSCFWPRLLKRCLRTRVIGERCRIAPLLRHVSQLSAIIHDIVLERRISRSWHCVTEMKNVAHWSQDTSSSVDFRNNQKAVEATSIAVKLPHSTSMKPRREDDGRLGATPIHLLSSHRSLQGSDALPTRDVIAYLRHQAQTKQALGHTLLLQV